MDQRDKKKLVDVFNVAVEEMAQRGNKLAVITDKTLRGSSDAYAQKSWDRYFTDLSFGSYRPLITDGRTIGRARAWHFLLKNLAFVNKLYSNEKQEVRILDVGCSSGYLRRFIEGNQTGVDASNLYYWGLDIREKQILKAVLSNTDSESGAEGEQIPSVFAVHDVGKSLPFISNAFDYVAIFEMIKYLPIGEGSKLISECKRVLKKTGIVSISVPTSHEYYKEKRPDYMISLSPNELIDIMESQGLVIDQVYGSQGSYKYLGDNIKPEHKDLFEELNSYFPDEITTAIFTPLYPEYSTQITFYAHG